MLKVKNYSSPVVVSGESSNMPKSSFDDWYTFETGILRYTSTGSLGFLTENELMQLVPGQMIYFPPLALRAAKCTSDNDSIGWRIFIPVEHTKKLPNSPCIFGVTELMAKLCERIVSWGPITQLSAAQERLVATFFDELYAARSVEHFHIPLPASLGLSLVAKKIIDAPQDRKQVKDWAKMSGMSLRSFTSQFAEETGMLFSAWRQRIRLQAAMRLLSQNQSVAQVANDLGYSSPSSFIEIFRKQFGEPPKQYFLRTRAKKNAP